MGHFFCQKKNAAEGGAVQENNKAKEDLMQIEHFPADKRVERATGESLFNDQTSKTTFLR